MDQYVSTAFFLPVVSTDPMNRSSKMRLSNSTVGIRTLKMANCCRPARSTAAFCLYEILCKL